MEFQLKDCRTGKSALYKTIVYVSEKARKISFRFAAEYVSGYCPYRGYNENHYEGDVCEVFIGTAAQPDTYYEIEVTPNNDLFFAKVTYLGQNADGSPITTVERIPQVQCPVKSIAQRLFGGLIVEITVDITKLFGEEETLVFNAYRIETDGGERDKHLFALNPTMLETFHDPRSFVLLDKHDAHSL